MIPTSIKGKLKLIQIFLFTHRGFSVVIITLIFLFSFAGLILINYLTSLASFPNFELTEFQITELENNSIKADISLELSTPSFFDIQIRQIKCKIIDHTQGMEKIIAEGTTESITNIKSNQKVVNISFQFITSDIQNLITRLAEGDNFSLKGELIFLFGFSSSFEIESDKIEVSFFPSLKIIDMHPVYPGNILEITIETFNPHLIDFNLTKISFDVFTPNFGILGTVNMTNLIIATQKSSIDIQFESGESELSWLFEQVLNDGIPTLEVTDFSVTLAIGQNLITISLDDGPNMKNGFEPSLEILGIRNLAIEGSTIAFDIDIGLQGEPLWGYNITPTMGEPWAISFDFSHKLGGDELQVVGNGSSNVTTQVDYHELVEIPISVNIFPIATAELIWIWINQGEIEINLQNGQICLQFYEVKLKISFSHSMN
ncbi:MAG: hypothetical protein EAX86_07140 [Candidatus Heimdallarchaeota archaeon]|nr:hypothetical protein [Candidatus Heimdallarchaeota archaeon]